MTFSMSIILLMINKIQDLLATKISRLIRDFLIEKSHISFFK